MNVLAMHGSLRSASINAAFCRVVARCARPPVTVKVFSGLGSLPLFNPDLESSPPATVLEFRTAIHCADALLIASPEYAHGISGAMKNALDWLVSYEGTIDKPIALINTSPRAHHAYESLREVLRTMSTTLIDGASLSIPLLGVHKSEDSMRADPSICKSAQHVLSEIAKHLSGAHACGPAFPVA
jgi:chromate reductase, NAD(P)H dehydrogenase (quinone)